jgi:hypothetical protein
MIMRRMMFVPFAAMLIGIAGPAAAQSNATPQETINGVDLRANQGYDGSQPVVPQARAQDGDPKDVTPKDWWRAGDKKQPAERSANNVPGAKPDKPADWWRAGERRTQ